MEEKSGDGLPEPLVRRQSRHGAVGIVGEIPGDDGAEAGDLGGAGDPGE